MDTQIIENVIVAEVEQVKMSCFTRISMLIKKYFSCFCESSCQKK